ncbi:MAG: ABC transporter ATP-binding protein [Phycisphaerae bacterium]|jgi:ATP-binding cassette, subfamily B, bacterial MsbA|nr:ABC transporter ATP-binding protein [Phycisphaerae bacterium]HJN71180.1 ABC transporter ATP-binding protein [Phycisphaerales bacterium]
MTHFKHFAKQMLQWRGRLILAVALAIFSAMGLGVGLLSLGPALSLILNPESGQALPELAQQFNSENHIIAVPQWLIEKLPADRFDGVMFILIGVGCLTLVGGIANFLHSYLSGWIAVHTVARVRKQAFGHVLGLELGRVLRSGASEFISRIVRDAEALQAGLTVLMGKSVAHFSKGVAAFIVACVFDVQLVVIAILVLPVLAFVLQKIGRRIRKGSKTSLAVQQELLRISNEAVQGLRAVKVNTAEQSIQSSFSSENERLIKAEMKVRVARALMSPLMEILSIIVLGALAAIAAKSIIDGTLDFDRFLLSIGSLAVACGSLRPLSGMVAQIQASEAPAERLQDILTTPLEDETLRQPISPHTKTIVFEDVSFAYDDVNEPSIRGISLTINHGESVAIVGPNGSGKTTLLSMLPRLLTPQSGTILIDGIDIATVDLHSLRSQIGVVTQETVLFRGTIDENIRFGIDATLQQVKEAAERAHAADFIEAMDGAYSANVYESGTSLSGGQRQRLAIARALLRDPSILILDEATSQIDTESESLINDTLDSFCESRTVLIIAHRLSTVQMADRIIVLNQGSLVDTGTHDELLSRCDVYARLAQTQLVSSDA